MKVSRALSLAVGAITLVLAAPAVASADTVVAYEMEEGPSTATDGDILHDSGTNGLNGHIGNLIQRRVPTGSGDYGFTFQGPVDVPNDERLATVPDNPALDPGTLPYKVTVRFRTTRGKDPNIVQKGQSGQTGGFWKVVLHNGWPRCHFRDGNGNTKAIGFVNGFPDYVKAGDGLWHTFICERTADGVRATIDPGEPEGATNFIRGTIGRIDNSRPLSIGGKVDCDSVTVGCDYFTGTMAYVHIEHP
ncbi:hypothetical protein ACT8ZV_22640 [Nocardioides sp. MAHUQ-72]|uniref:hypothetical protein n=1 Tax=unclassified Nocardioides TaxID=2615069 RepID=UPI00361F91F5